MGSTGGRWPAGHGAHSYWWGSALCFAESRLERNSVAAFLLLVKNFIQNHPVNQESLVQCHGPAIIGALLQKVWGATKSSIPWSPGLFPVGDTGAGSLSSHPWQVSGPLLDMSTLMASQILMEQVASEGSGLLLHLLYQHLLFDFRIWSNSDFAVRLGGTGGAWGFLPILTSLHSHSHLLPTGHIQYLGNVVKDHKQRIRKKYGVQYVLDSIRTFYG